MIIKFYGTFISYRLRVRHFMSVLQRLFTIRNTKPLAY